MIPGSLGFVSGRVVRLEKGLHGTGVGWRMQGRLRIEVKIRGLRCPVSSFDPVETCAAGSQGTGQRQQFPHDLGEP